MPEKPVTRYTQAGEVSIAVRDLLFGADVEFAERGQHVLKGIPNAWDLYSVERAR